MSGARQNPHAHQLPFMPAAGYINDDTVLEWGERLWRDAAQLRWLRDHRGLEFETLVGFYIGFDGWRYTIPICDWYGRIVNVGRKRRETGPNYTNSKPFYSSLSPQSPL